KPDLFLSCTVACTLPSAKSRVCPARGGLLARRWAKALRSSSRRSIRHSTRPPVVFWPNKRALMTRVVLKTKRSFGCNNCGKSVNCMSCKEQARGRNSRQLDGCTLFSRVLCNQLGREFIVKILSTQIRLCHKKPLALLYIIERCHAWVVNGAAKAAAAVFYHFTLKCGNDSKRGVHARTKK